MRLIDAYALQDKIHKSKMENPHKDAKVAQNHEFEHDHFMRMVTLQPTAQEEVIRCEDCKYKGQTIHQEDGTNIIVCWNQGYGIHHPINWFCADGKRRESGNESSCTICRNDVR